MIPRMLEAPDHGWSEHTDICVVGSGVAGLTLALNARKHGHRVSVITKVHIDDGSTRWAQGGVAAVLDPYDTPEAHARDTLTAGAGLSRPEAVEILTREGPECLYTLMNRGAEFDRDSDGYLLLTREGGHSARRIVHAGGDATGWEIQRALHAAVRADPGIHLIEHAMVLDVLRGAHGQAVGVTLHVLGEGSTDGVGAVFARAVVLASGGLGQVYSVTTNPEVSTGDGVAAALRAGAQVADLEFVQFHPTALSGVVDASGRAPLISEALRGEGAHLVDAHGERFMLERDHRGELAPRDIVARGVFEARQHTGGAFLDARHLGAWIEERFPTIVQICKEAGVDPVHNLIPVAPAAHYASGGVRTDVYGRTSVPGLYACGEVACTGVHGANRLASNSLLEGLVFARRIAEVTRELSPHADPVFSGVAARTLSPTLRDTIRALMSTGASVQRSAESLHTARSQLTTVLSTQNTRCEVRSWETSNLATVAAAILHAATLRRETRGAQWRSDYPHADPAYAHSRSVTLDDLHKEFV